MNDISTKLESLLQEINDAVVFTIARRIKKVGRLNSVELKKIDNILRYYNEDITTIRRKLAIISKKSVKEIDRMIRESAEESGTEIADWFHEDYKKTDAIEALMTAASAKAVADFLNISDTTVMWLDGKNIQEAYINAINKAVLSVTTGVQDYNAAMRETIKSLSGSGLSIRYKSGVYRRIDSAVRMNILDGMRTMNAQIRREEGKIFGADGVYIMPHRLCAPDHLIYQGKEYTYEEWDEVNAKLERPIATGQMNCGHIAYDRVVGDPLPYTADELAEMNAWSGEKVTWNGKEMTRYEASQKMRNSETSIRRLKDVRNGYRESGDKEYEMRYNEYIAKARKKYFSRCEACGLSARRDLL